jgi:hypothetical protein
MQNRLTLVSCAMLASASVVILSAIVLCTMQPDISSYDRCVTEMLGLWDCARSYSVCKNIPVDQPLDPRIIQREYLGNKKTFACPLDTVPYPPFSLVNGPVCPKGHQLPSETRRTLCAFYALWNGATNTQHLLNALQDTSGLVRMAGIQSVTPELADTTVINELNHIACTDTNYYYACGRFNSVAANIAARAVLHELTANASKERTRLTTNNSDCSTSNMRRQDGVGSTH